MNKTSASVTIHVDVFDEQALWDHAKSVMLGTPMGPPCTEQEFVEMCGPREEPSITECLRMIFDPGESPPGIQINDSSAEVEPAF